MCSPACFVDCLDGIQISSLVTLKEHTEAILPVDYLFLLRYTTEMSFHHITSISNSISVGDLGDRFRQQEGKNQAQE